MTVKNEFIIWTLFQRATGCFTVSFKTYGSSWLLCLFLQVVMERIDDMIVVKGKCLWQSDTGVMASISFSTTTLDPWFLPPSATLGEHIHYSNDT